MDQEALEYSVGQALRQRGLRLAVAESCTGGLVGHRLTNVAGSSDYFLGGVIAYANQVKEGMLGVEHATLLTYGAVSRETVLEMARGVRQRLGADVGLAVSGIAGPGGGTPEKPVGLVWIGLSAADQETARRYQFAGARLAVKEQAAQSALLLLAEYLGLPQAGSASYGAGAAKPVDLLEVEVRARYNSQGEALPVRLSLDSVGYQVEALGRRWKDAQGEHILVMLVGGKVLELIYDPGAGRWYAREAAKGKPFA